MAITYQTEPNLEVADFINLLERSGLAERRPIQDIDRITKMIQGAQIMLTARRDGELIGMARAITDWSYALYCSELCVAKDAQGLGIGKALLAETAKLAPNVKNHFLLSAPNSVSFYEQAEYAKHPAAFLFHEGD